MFHLKIIPSGVTDEEFENLLASLVFTATTPFSPLPLTPIRQTLGTSGEKTPVNLNTNAFRTFMDKYSNTPISHRPALGKLTELNSLIEAHLEEKKRSSDKAQLLLQQREFELDKALKEKAYIVNLGEIAQIKLKEKDLELLALSELLQHARNTAEQQQREYADLSLELESSNLQSIMLSQSVNSLQEELVQLRLVSSERDYLALQLKLKTEAYDILSSTTSSDSLALTSEISSLRQKLTQLTESELEKQTKLRTQLMTVHKTAKASLTASSLEKDKLTEMIRTLKAKLQRTNLELQKAGNEVSRQKEEKIDSRTQLMKQIEKLEARNKELAELSQSTYENVVKLLGIKESGISADVVVVAVEELNKAMTPKKVHTPLPSPHHGEKDGNSKEDEEEDDHTDRLLQQAMQFSSPGLNKMGIVSTPLRVVHEEDNGDEESKQLTHLTGLGEESDDDEANDIDTTTLANTQANLLKASMTDELPAITTPPNTPTEGVTKRSIVISDVRIEILHPIQNSSSLLVSLSSFVTGSDFFDDEITTSLKPQLQVDGTSINFTKFCQIIVAFSETASAAILPKISDSEAESVTAIHTAILKLVEEGEKALRATYTDKLATDRLKALLKQLDSYGDVWEDAEKK